MVQATAKQGALYTLDVPELEQYKEGDHIPMEQLMSVFHSAAQNWSWTATDPEDDLRAAVELLQANARLSMRN
jgi:salicylate hydroxylase